MPGIYLKLDLTGQRRIRNVPLVVLVPCTVRAPISHNPGSLSPGTSPAWGRRLERAFQRVLPAH